MGNQLNSLRKRLTTDSSKEIKARFATFTEKAETKVREQVISAAKELPGNRTEKMTFARKVLIEIFTERDKKFNDPEVLTQIRKRNEATFQPQALETMCPTVYKRDQLIMVCDGKAQGFPLCDTCNAAMQMAMDVNKFYAGIVVNAEGAHFGEEEV